MFSLRKCLTSARISLVVLADRGGRELPICAQHFGAKVELPQDTRLRLSRLDDGKLKFDLERAA